MVTKNRHYVLLIGALFILVCGCESCRGVKFCQHYIIQTSHPDPASTEYENDPKHPTHNYKMMWSYAWGAVNKPQIFVAPNCGSGTGSNQPGLDEVRISPTFAGVFLEIITLGCISQLKVQWKCHKPCQQSGVIN